MPTSHLCITYSASQQHPSAQYDPHIHHTPITHIYTPHTPVHVPFTRQNTHISLITTIPLHTCINTLKHTHTHPHMHTHTHTHTYTHTHTQTHTHTHIHGSLTRYHLDTSTRGRINTHPSLSSALSSTLSPLRFLLLRLSSTFFRFLVLVTPFLFLHFPIFRPWFYYLIFDFFFSFLLSYSHRSPKH